VYRERLTFPVGVEELLSFVFFYKKWRNKLDPNIRTVPCTQLPSFTWQVH